MCWTSRTHFKHSYQQEVDKYLQEAAAKQEMDINYFDAQHVAMNTVNHQQIDDVAEIGKDNILELVDNDTSKMSDNNTKQYIQYNEGLEGIPEETDEDIQVMVQGDGDDGDTIPYIQGDSEDEQFNIAIDNTSDDPMIVMGKPLTTAFVSVNVCVPTEQVGCLISENSLAIFHQNLRKKL